MKPLMLLLAVTLLPACTARIPAGAAVDYRWETPALPAPGELTIISWNINKNDLENAELKRVVETHEPDILCLQEVTGRTCPIFADRFLQCRFAPSWMSRCEGVVTGILTLSRFEITSTLKLVSPDREFVFFTPKASMISTVELAGGAELMVINVHVLNFVPLGLIEDQLDELLVHAETHCGPMVVCGDFNTWNSQRMEAVNRFAARLGLVKPLAVCDSGGTAPDWLFFLEPFLEINLDAPLDHIFCREFEIIAFDRLDGYTSSDHSPLLLKVRLLSD